MVIVETPIFTKRVIEVLDDEQYRRLQTFLVSAPESGDILRGSGGLRKVRWAGSGRGKRGGIRVIYYWFPHESRLMMLFLFAKNEQSDLTTKQMQALRQVVEEELLS